MLNQSSARVFCLTALALIAFAANSVIARLALAGDDIGPGSFTTIRFVSGAVVLAILTAPKAGGVSKLLDSGNWRSAVVLLLYGALFSYAYLMLTAGTGALILFAAVQLTMLGGGLLAGERLNAVQWTGTAIAIAGLIYLLSPNIKAPSITGAVLMMGSGIGWGLYSLLGRGAGDPAAQTAGNFIRAGFICLIMTPLVLRLLPETNIEWHGAGLALLSGTVTSGLGYIIWYMALKHLTAMRAGIAQLSVPAIAAIGGVLFIAEPLTLRFVFTAFVILGGVAIATMTPQNPKQTLGRNRN